MKMIAVFICFLFLFSCKKNNNNDELLKLNGKWELRRIEYGYSVQPEILFNADNGNTISFSGNNQFNRTDVIDNDTITSSGIYRITHSVTCSSKAVTVIDFPKNEVANTSVISISLDSLYFKSDSCVITDGLERTYVRVH